MREDREFISCAHRVAAGAASAPNLKPILLGKTPRYAPDRSVDTRHIRLDLRLDMARRAVSGTCRTTIRAFRDGVRVVAFDAVDLRVASVEVAAPPAAAGRRAAFKLRKGKLAVTLPRALGGGEEAEVRVRYSFAEPKAGLHFVYPGPHNPRNPVQVWSQSQPEDARYWFPCHDAPHQKTTSEVVATVPKGFTAVSNGALVSETHHGARSTFHWRMSQPHSVYLISLAAGRFAELRETWDGVPVAYYCEKGREADARRGFAKTVKALDFFSKKTGVRYPYEKYAQVAVAEYPGGMENTTCTTQTDAVLIDRRAALDTDLDLLVAHELAHQWFGDLVTCRDWSHAWLNEGFATYFEVLFQEHDKGRDEADFELRQNAESYFEEDARRYRRPIVCATYKEPWTLFDRHLYEKGAWVLHMLKRELGDGLWWKAVGAYLRKFRGRSVETSDLIESIHDATGLNVKPFFDQWVFRAGYPEFRVQYQWDAKKRRAELWVLQTQAVSDEAPAFKTPVTLRFTGRGWAKEFTETVDGKEHRFRYTLPSEPLNAEFDPEGMILKKLDARKPLAMWVHQLRRGKTALARHDAAAHVAGWGDAAAAALLEEAARREPFWGAAAEMARALGAVRTEAAYAALKRLLSHKHPKVRRAVVAALGGFKRPETAKLLAPLARRDPSIHVAASALRALGGLREERWGALLRGALKTQSYRDVVSAGAVSALAAARDPRQTALLHRLSRPPSGFGARVSAIRALADFAPVERKVIPWLCELTADPDERINLVAVATLGSLEDERALPTLKKLAKEAANTRVKVYAQEALARIRAGVEEKKS